MNTIPSTTFAFATHKNLRHMPDRFHVFNKIGLLFGQQIAILMRCPDGNDKRLQQVTLLLHARKMTTRGICIINHVRDTHYQLHHGSHSKIHKDNEIRSVTDQCCNFPDCFTSLISFVNGFDRTISLDQTQVRLVRDYFEFKVVDCCRTQRYFMTGIYPVSDTFCTSL